MSEPSVRAVPPAEAEALRALRQRALREEPHAFLSSEAEGERRDLDEWRANLAGKWAGPEQWVLGAYREGELVGMAGCFRGERDKERHKAIVWGMYVAPEARGLGLGRALLSEAVARMRALKGVLQVQLSVTAGNEAALGLYRRLGFQDYGREPRAMQVGEDFLDELYLVLPLDA